MPHATRVIERFLEASLPRRKKALADSEVAELKRHLFNFQKLLDSLAKEAESVEANPEDYGAQVSAGAAVRATFHFAKQYGIEMLVLTVLRGYQLTPKQRKILERGARTLAKRQMNRIKPDKAVAVFTKFTNQLVELYETTKEVIERGRFHTEEGDTTLKAGPFTLINTGGFSEKQMEDVAKVVEKAAQQLSRVGLSRVCYGNIQVTNTIGRSARILAFYLKGRDELFVRANLRGSQAPAVASVIHELGHRLHFKFLAGKDRQIQEIYEVIADRNRQALWDMRQDPSKRPKPGDTIPEGRKTWVVGPEGVQVNSRGQAGVIVELQSDPKKRAIIRLEEWFKQKGDLAFVSPYAEKNHEENFAEMVAHYALGTLPDDQEPLLKNVL